MSPYKRILPNGRVELLVNLGESYRIVRGAGTAVLRAAWIGGLLTSPQVIEQPRRQNVVGIRMYPAAAYSLLAVPMREIAGLQIALEDIIGVAASELAAHCAEAGSARQLFARVAKWLSERVMSAPGIDPAIAWCAARIDADGGRVPIAELRERTGLSKTSLAASFREQIGVAPKVYARLVRFRHATELLQRDARNLVDVALEAGFYDQPHMNAEFRELGGLTPLDFIAARHPVGDGTTARVEPPFVPPAAIRPASRPTVRRTSSEGKAA
jgi:AraC-like DNA-binding protein